MLTEDIRVHIREPEIPVKLRRELLAERVDLGNLGAQLLVGSVEKPDYLREGCRVRTWKVLLDSHLCHCLSKTKQNKKKDEKRPL